MTKTHEIFAICLASWTSACGDEKSRLKPGSGLSLPNFGLSMAGENRKPNCKIFASSAMPIAARNAVPISPE